MKQYKDVVREMFARHKGQPPKDIMRMASAEWQAIKAGKKPAKAGRKARGGAIDPLSIASSVSSALPVVGDLVSGISDLFSGKPDPDKQLQRDYALREYNRLNGTRYGVEGTHWNVPYGAGLKKRGKRGGAMSAGAMSAGAMSAGSLGNIATIGKLASGLRGMGGSGGYRTLGSMNRGGAVSAGSLGGYVSGGGASGGAVSAGSLGDILSSALPFMSLI